MTQSVMFKSAKKFLDTQFSTLFLDKNTLAVLYSEKDTSPFLLVSNDPKIFEGLILSFVVDYTNVVEAIGLSLALNEIGPIVLEERFLVTSTGVLIFGEEAEMYNNPLMEMEVNSKDIH